MMGKTHMMIGAVVGAVVEAKAPGLSFLGGAAVGALGGLIPDLDHPNGTLTNKVVPIAIGNKKVTMALMAVGIIYLGIKGYLPLPSILAFSLWLLITALSKHRGFTHSLLGLVATIYAVHGWLGGYELAFGAAYLSHLLADSLTDSRLDRADHMEALRISDWYSSSSNHKTFLRLKGENEHVERYCCKTGG